MINVAKYQSRLILKECEQEGLRKRPVRSAKRSFDARKPPDGREGGLWLARFDARDFPYVAHVLPWSYAAAQQRFRKVTRDIS